MFDSQQVMLGSNCIVAVVLMLLEIKVEKPASDVQRGRR